MANTSFGLRMNATIENTKYEDSIFLTLMGDRARQYVEGWLFFLQNPWTGIGLRKYAEVNSYWQDSGGVLHTEYIVQLAECGIIGSILFLVFYFGMIKRLFTKESNSIKIVLRSTLLAIIAVNFVAWTYDSISYFIVYGMIYAFCETSRHAQAVTHSDIRYNAVQTVSST